VEGGRWVEEAVNEMKHEVLWRAIRPNKLNSGESKGTKRMPISHPPHSESGGRSSTWCIH